MTKPAWLAILILSILGTLDRARADENFRISEVVRQAGEGVEEMTVKQAGQEDERLWVKREAALTGSDVKEAAVVLGPEPQILIQLTEEGSRKMKALTERVRGERLALVVDGKLISAPEVMATLEDHFLISGEYELRELQNLARQLMGRPALAAGEPDDPAPVPVPVPKIKTVPFTEEEYQARKAAREMAGMYHLEKIPSWTELDAMLWKGMTPDELIQVLGPPTMRFPPEETGMMMYKIAPEKRPGTSKVSSGLMVHFRNGKVASWGLSYDSMPREEKVVGRVPGVLKMILPAMDLSAAIADFVKYFEAIQVPDPKQRVNESDLMDLISLTAQTAAVAEVTQPVKADCDLLLTLAHHFPEVAALREQAKGGGVPLAKLNAALMPYFNGHKPMPDGSGQPAKASGK